MTFDKIPDVDSSVDLFDNSEKILPITAPDGYGWSHQESFLGNNSIIHIWKKGTPQFDDGYELYWTGCGDDTTNGIIGGGEDLIIEVSDTDTVDQTIDIEFIADETYLYGGQAMWSGSQLHDSISLVVVAKATPIATGGDLSLTVTDNKIQYVGVGNGTHYFTGTPVFVENKSGTGLWNLDTSGASPSAVPASGDGGYDMFDIEKTVSRLLNKIPTSPNNDGYVAIAGHTAWKIFHGYKFRFIAHVQPSNPHTWSCSLFLHMFRRNTI